MNLAQWFRDKMYQDEIVPKRVPLGLPPTIFDNPLGGEPLELDNSDMSTIEPQTVKGNRPTTFGRFVQGMPRMLGAGIAAAATPNIAMGGATDIFRAMQAGQDRLSQQDLLAMNLQRQHQMDERLRRSAEVENAYREAQMPWLLARPGIEQRKVDTGETRAQTGVQRAGIYGQDVQSKDQARKSTAERGWLNSQMGAAGKGLRIQKGNLYPYGSSSESEPTIEAIPESELPAESQSRIRRNTAAANASDARAKKAGKTAEDRLEELDGLGVTLTEQERKYFLTNGRLPSPAHPSSRKTASQLVLERQRVADEQGLEGEARQAYILYGSKPSSGKKSSGVDSLRGLLGIGGAEESGAPAAPRPAQPKPSGKDPFASVPAAVKAKALSTIEAKGEVKLRGPDGVIHIYRKQPDGTIKQMR